MRWIWRHCPSDFFDSVISAHICVWTGIVTICVCPRIVTICVWTGIVTICVRPGIITICVWPGIVTICVRPGIVTEKVTVVIFFLWHESKEGRALEFPCVWLLLSILTVVPQHSTFAIIISFKYQNIMTINLLLTSHSRISSSLCMTCDDFHRLSLGYTTERKSQLKTSKINTKLYQNI